ncbi:MAG TPA: glycosyltransferase family 2 protein [Ferruginibacter sp.]|nr:glycosyltransferase family 2 protein [Ferruginibacter sp.]
MLLGIYIVTYNRSKYLGNTLDSLLASPLSNCKITVLNNASTDDTVSVVVAYQSQFENLDLFTHKNNVGASANILRALEMSDADYTWVLCDDDQLNLADVDEMMEIMKDGQVDLIHVGAHAEIKWDNAGKKTTPKELLNSGYHYFKASSFTPCNIFRTDKFQKKYLIAGYNNIANAYCYMPFIANVYEDNGLIYLTNTRLVTAIVGNQHYNTESWFFWWLNSCKTLKTKEGVRIAFFDHFSDSADDVSWLHSIMRELYLKDESYKTTILNFVNTYFNDNEKKAFFKLFNSDMKNELIKNLRQKIKGKIKMLIGYKTASAN